MEVAIGEEIEGIFYFMEMLVWQTHVHHHLILFWFESQTDLEEEKAQEIAKLQDALHAMQMQVEEANARVIKEREAARKAIEEAPPVIKETPVLVQDTLKVEQLMAEVQSLKVCTQTWIITVHGVLPKCLPPNIISVYKHTDVLNKII